MLNTDDACGGGKFVRLKALNISAEMTKDLLSLIGIVFRRLTSVEKRPGPVNTMFPISPRYPGAAGAKQAGFRYVRFGEDFQFGRTAPVGVGFGQAALAAAQFGRSLPAEFGLLA